jgi:putative ABC transport system permease protein
MFSNYLLVAFRNLQRYKAYSFINVTGLAVGIACCLMIFLYVHDELSFDKYHADLNRIYRIAQKNQSPTNISASASICAPAAYAIKGHFPQIESMARVLPVTSGLVKHENQTFYEDGRMYADTDLFSVLTIPFLRGDPETALDRPATVVITQRMAEKYFGDSDPVGKTIGINSRDYEVTGVAANPPANTHLKYDFILSLKTLEGRYPFDRWFLSNFYTYVKLTPNAELTTLSEQLVHIADTYAKEEVEALGETVTYFLQPISDIHLHSHLQFEAEPGGNPLYLYIFSAVGLLVVIIACINFVNLSTARSIKRAKEVGMRKVVGANRRQLIWQFLGESFFITAVALFVAVVLVGSLLPLVNDLTDKSFELIDLVRPQVFLALAAIATLVGLSAGSYPAFVLSSWNAANSLKDAISRGSPQCSFAKVLGGRPIRHLHHSCDRDHGRVRAA